MSDLGDAFELDVALSGLAADSGDTQLMMRLLTERLSEALGDRLRVERGGGMFRKSNEIKKVEVRIAETEMVAELSNPPSFSIGRVSGGIRIRTEKTDAAGWLSALLGALNKEAEHSAAARQALESIVIGGR